MSHLPRPLSNTTRHQIMQNNINQICNGTKKTQPLISCVQQGTETTPHDIWTSHCGP